jgi:MurNAc alpha-1-phosphate uridylyltransferase
MIAMILAAGRGERMRPLSDTVPKPLLEVAGKPLIVHQIEALNLAGIERIIINTGRLGKQIQHYLGTGQSLGVSILYSEEGDEPLETAGGIIKALPLLGDEPFIVANADIYSDFDYQSLPKELNIDGHLVLVDNPPHNPEGDFALEGGLLRNDGTQRLTYSGIGIYSAAFFKDCACGKLPLAPLLRHSAQENRLSGQHFAGYWNDIGTPQRLDEVNKSRA